MDISYIEGFVKVNGSSRLSFLLPGPVCSQRAPVPLSDAAARHRGIHWRADDTPAHSYQASQIILS